MTKLIRDNAILIPEWVFGELNPSQIHMYGTLLFNADPESGEVTAGVADMAKEMQCSESTVIRALKELEKREVIAREERRDGSGRRMTNLIRVNVESDDGSKPSKVEK